MACPCALTSFNEYFVDEANRIQKQIEDFPETFKDIWSGLASVQQDAVAEEALVAVAQGVLSDTNINALIDLITAEVKSTLGAAQIPRFEGALEELSKVKDTQEAVKVLASIVFILWSDSIFHVMSVLAKKVLRLGALKVAQAEQLRAAVAVARASMAVFEAAGVDSQEIRDLLGAAAADILSAQTLVSQMRQRAVANTPIRQTLIDRSVAHLQDAIDKLVDSDVDAELVRAGAASTLLQMASPVAVASGGMLLASMHIKEIKSTSQSAVTLNRQISAAVISFLASIDEYRSAPMTNYQASVLTTVSNRLSATRSEMQVAARAASMGEIAAGFTTWVPSLGVAQRMLANLPPEIREQEQLNTTLVNAFNETCRRLRSISGDHVKEGLETTVDLEKAVSRLVDLMEDVFEKMRTSSVQELSTYLALSSSSLALPELSFVSAEMTPGVPKTYRVYESEVVEVPSGPAKLPAISRIDESIIQTTLVMEAMSYFLTAQPPENALLTALLELLKLLKMDRGRDLLAAGNISAFMDSSPLSWSYVGNAVDCIQKGMAAALDQGLDEIYDQLDSIAVPMMAKVRALELRMQRESAYSLDSILDKLQATVDELEKTKETLDGLIDKVDCDA